jgi:hypothetical protein
MHLMLNDIPSKISVCFKNRYYLTNEWQVIFSERNHSLRSYLCDIFVNCNWVDTRWHQYSTHLHTNNTQNSTMKQNTQNGICIKVKVKVTLEQATKGQRGSRGTSLLFS